MKFKRKKDAYQHALVVQEKVISTEVVQERFVCDLSKCKGACCVQGDVGAPLEKKERKILKDIYPVVMPYLTQEGIQAIQEQGEYILDFTNEYSTPLIDGKECAYTTFDEQGIARCGIEQAWIDGKTDFKKPISCHLYPIRIKKNVFLEAVNYDRWDICKAACSLGEKTGVRVYEFLKDALIRKFGQDFYEELDAVAKSWEATQNDTSNK